MAILDRRLTPIIEMLTELGMDWLAFELIEGVRRGQEFVENEDALELARHARQWRRRTREAENFARNPEDSVEGEPLLGDAQLEWAAGYVHERLEATLAEMSASLGALDKIVDSGREPQTTTTEPSAVLVLLDAEEDRPVGVTEIEEAQAHVAQLRQSLVNWLANARPDLDQ